MSLDNVRRAIIERAIATLEFNPDHSHKAAIIRQMADSSAVKLIAARAAAIKAENMQATNLLHLLAPASIAYHERTNRLIALGKRAQASANHKLERQVNHDSERLAEQFEELVPAEDWPKFVQWVADDEISSWDERWEYLEHRPPLLSHQFTTTYVHGDPMNLAQQEILGDLLPVNTNPTPVATVIERMTPLLRLAREGESAALAKAQKALEKAKKKERRQKLIDQGDQEVTKVSRSKRLKRVEGLFEDTSKR